MEVSDSASDVGDGPDDDDLAFVAPVLGSVDGIYTAEEVEALAEARRVAEASGGVFKSADRPAAWIKSLRALVKKVTTAQAGAGGATAAETSAPTRVSLSKGAAALLADLIDDIIASLYREMVPLAKMNKRSAFIADDVVSAIKLHFPGEVAKYAAADVARTLSSLAAGSGVPVLLHLSHVKQVFESQELLAPIYNRETLPAVAAAVEFVVSEVLELAINAMRDTKAGRLTARHVKLAIGNDMELERMFHKVCLAGGGVIPNIHGVLLPMRR
ncbi:histone H2A [Thecamonas trahens ATCC 50062]|uniref:Histone H2A n=1 Tax=Thecamonas trahens ATCC 50062 TaxID=461836 RepID=A0A0L0DCF7_THETB|nr:histone H2A [Thecamonas trahens ATCC 50062]KNC48993.1 histone H2A [Thecamonas trahens ATCC 50062]|eukprot:XP_013758406.1 histone H2A [Thecamonas trahens ATCC 50062]